MVRPDFVGMRGPTVMGLRPLHEIECISPIEYHPPPLLSLFRNRWCLALGSATKMGPCGRAGAAVLDRSFSAGAIHHRCDHEAHSLFSLCPFFVPPATHLSVPGGGGGTVVS